MADETTVSSQGGNMARDLEKMVERLNDLIALDRDAVEAYRSAIERISVEDLKSQLRAFQGDHERHTRDLSAVVLRFGGRPRERPDVKGFILKGFTAVTSSMGDGPALRAMKGNEELTNRTYARSLEEDWPDDVRVLIERNYSDEQRHLAAIEDFIRLRAEEPAGPVHP
jgi:uncharacterized protein (TIGR02284 family)